MADINHLELLRAGQSAWNRWRLDHRNTVPDLDAADLRGADLQEMNLTGARLSEADLAGANLAGAWLSSADLSRALLGRADLTSADLQNADATAADFRAASLARANLCWTNFERADLSGASLRDAELGRTILVDTDLAGARHLETCRFWAPVGIDSRTLIRCAAIPAPFLRGCGVPEPMIENLPALFPKTIEYYSVLIRYDVEDAVLAEQLDADLVARGIRCWRVQQTARDGPAARQVTLEDCFRSADTRLIVVISRNTGSNRTSTLERDIKVLLQNERGHNRKLLFAVRSDEGRLLLSEPVAEELNRRAIDFRRWKDHKGYLYALEKLVSALSS